MNERRQFRVLSLISGAIIALSAIGLSLGLVMYINLGNLGTQLPVKTVDQFRNIANLMPLMSDLQSNLDAVRTGSQELDLGMLGYTISKLKVAAGIVEAEYGGSPPYDFKTILDELSLLTDDLTRRIGSAPKMDRTTVILLNNRAGYIYSELRDYIFRVNNDTLLVLEKQRRELDRIKNAIFLYALMILSSIALTVALLRNQKRTMARLDESRKVAIESNNAKSEFLSNMSHEIRTPMNAIIGLSYLALKTSLTPSQKNYLKRIQISGQHLLGIINDILDFSKIEAGKLGIESVPFELDKILDNVANLTAEKAGTKGLELIFETDKEVPNHLVGDPLRLGQILINYANNAVKFTEKGEIGIRIRVREETPAGVLLHFEVDDTGVGITDQQKEQLFKSFQQADGSITRRYGGTGLGLAISKKLAAMMGGEVGVESEYGKGSSFWFTALLGRGEEGQRALIPLPDLRGRRVLVVDDNDHARAVIADMLGGMTFVVTAVASGPEALEEIAEASRRGQAFDLVFLDWQMPGMDGIETARRIRALPLERAAAMVIVTAFGREDVIKEAETAGIEEVLIKPVSPSILFDTAMHLLGAGWRERRESPAILDAKVSAPTGLAGARVLLVEDNALNQEVATEMLRSVGCVVSLAEDGAEAVRKSGENDYDIVLMDMQMPVMDGLAATREIRKETRLATLPIIAMTANAMVEDRDRCLAAGMNDYISKPIDPDAMFAVLRRYYAGSPELVPAVAPEVAPAVAPEAVPAAGQEIAPELASPREAGRETPTADLPKIEGIDTEGGLRRVIGNRNLYRDLLRRFSEGQRDFDARIREAFESGNLQLAERLAHTLKGVAGNIGAVEVQAVAGELEACINGKALKSAAGLLERLSTIIATTLEKIDRALAESIEPAAVPARAGETLRSLDEMLERLGRYAEESDSEAVEYFDSTRGELAARLGLPIAEELGRAIRAYDFPAALDILRGISRNPVTSR
ncbi:MAG: response regulator [Treponema sp.]|nr:response regulator [Treponema sp.]